MTVTVRFFAGAAEAAGHEEETIASGSAATVGDLRALLAARDAELARVLGLCSVLVGGTRSEDDRPLVAGDTVDVLPPFAGG